MLESTVTKINKCLRNIFIVTLLTNVVNKWNLIVNCYQIYKKNSEGDLKCINTGKLLLIKNINKTLVSSQSCGISNIQKHAGKQIIIFNPCKLSRL